MKPCLSTLFDQYDGLWGVFTVKKTQRYTPYDLQGHARVQIFTYKDVSVCNVSSPNFHMFYEASCFHANISTLSCSCTSSHTKRHDLCVTLNISHIVCHIISHRCSRNKVQHHNFLNLRTLLTMQLLTYKNVPCANCHIGRRDCVQLIT